VRKAVRDVYPDLRRRWLRPGVIGLVVIPSALAIVSGGFPEAAVDASQPTVEAPRLAGEFEDVVALAWRKRALERERERAVGHFAREFSISTELSGKIYGSAVAHAIKPEIAFGLVRTESSFRRTAVSHAGAVGYTQLLPSTARWIVPGTPRSALFDAETNLDVGFRYLRYLKDKYDGDVDLALTAYNRGQGRVDSLLRAGRNPDNGYARAVRTGHVSRTLIRQNSPRSQRG
jgi:soluble lytic murein transglycosylase-like protein